MRVLFTGLPLPSHLRTFIPFAQALLAGGHTVTAALSLRGHQYLAPYGIDLVDAGVDLTALSGQPVDGSCDSPAPRPLALPMPAPDLFVGLAAERNLHAYLPLAEELHPDLILHEDAEFGGYLAAEKLGIPHACISACGAAATIDPAWLRPRLNHHRERLGLPPEPAGTALYRYRFLDNMPPAYSFLKHPIPTTRRYRLPLPEHRLEAVPDWFVHLPDDRPLVVAAMGTVVQHSAAQLLHRVIDALSDLKCTAIIITGKNLDPAQLGILAEHVHVVEYLPQPLLLPGADLLVNHGGINSIREALQVGVPLVLTPFGADQPHNAARATELGLGVQLKPAAATVEQLRNACDLVLTDPHFARRVRQAQRHFFTLPDAHTAVDDLDSLVR